MPIRPLRQIAPDHSAGRPEIQPRARVRCSPPPQPAATVSPSASTPPTSKPYDIGYGKPPKATQFKPGQSGNPKGRPKGARGLNTIVVEKMTEKLPVRTARGRRKMAKVEVMVQQSIDAGLGGNERERSRMLERYRAAVPDEPLLVPGPLIPAAEEPPPIPEDLALDLAMLDQLRVMLAAAQAGGVA